MKKALKIAIPIAAVLLLIFFFLLINGIIVLDHSAERCGEGAGDIFWKNTLYVHVHTSGQYHEGKTIAKTKDGWSINEVTEDPSHTFIVMRSFLDQYLLVREDYQIPNSGEITTVRWGADYTKGHTFASTISDILSKAAPDFEYETDAIFRLTDTQKMKELWIGYEACPLATEFSGYLGKINGTWYLTIKIHNQAYDENGVLKSCKVDCYTIPQEYHTVLEQYFPI